MNAYSFALDVVSVMYYVTNMTMTTTPNADTVTMAPGQLNRYRGEFRSAGPARRWIGRCRCGAGLKLEGAPLYDAKGDAAVLGADGLLYTTRVLNSHELVLVKHFCGQQVTEPVDPAAVGGMGTWPGRWVFCRPVVDGGKPDSKRHTCGSKCTNATGPSCDCRCRGANHGSGH